VRHIIVCGHYGCSGIAAALRGDRLGLCDNWLRHAQDVREKHQARLAGLANPVAAHDRLCELNVVEQVVNVCHTSIVRDAWERGQPLAVHGWVYGLRDGLVRDLGATVAARSELDDVYRGSLQSLA
jgi:carbonic anhydrase